ncbi:hypothetical protein R5R35_012216 [Gryllus longicercus]
MVGLWSPDPPPEPENLEENNAGYFVVTASDEEHEDEGYEGYEPLSDVDDDDNDEENEDEEIDEELNPQFTNTSASDCDARDRTRPADVARSAANCREFCKYLLPAPEENIDEAECASSSSTGCNTQESSDGIEAGPSSSRLEMGEQQVADVMAAMANVTLPPSAVPQWATVVPEDQWIQHILARVKLLQNKNISDK